MQTKLLIFDQDGTLYSRNSNLMKYTRLKTKKWIAKELNISDEEVEKIYAELPIKYPNPYLGFMSLGCEVSDYMSQVFDKIEPQDFLEFNKELYMFFKNNNIRKSLVTMSSKTYTKKLQSCLKLYDFYESILYVNEFKTYNKKEGYKMLAKKLNVSYPEICVIGDSIENDLKPAKDIGCKTVLISEHVNNEYRTVKNIEEFIRKRAYE
ncbi:MAG: HAD family hydrolase [Clostridia bacterium]|nr:HAD family hydrolase [Clostridia bacterium]